MVKNLLLFSLHQRLLTVALAFLLVCGGVYSWISLRKEAYPDVGDTQVTVIAKFPGRAAKEVEELVTIPLERTLNALPRVILRRSKTIFGLATLQLVFEDGIDDYFARARVLEKLGEADLPSGVDLDLAPLTSPVGEVTRYLVTGDERYTSMELRTIQDWVIIPRLVQVRGVADVINFGGLVKQFHVVTSPERLARYNYDIDDIIQAVQQNNVNTGGNIIRRGEQGFALRAMGAIHSKEDIENIVISSEKSVPIFIRDIATVEESPLPPAGVLGVHRSLMGEPETDNATGVQGLVVMLRGEDPTAVGKDVAKAIHLLNEKDLPPGVQVQITYDRSELVNYTLGTVGRTLFEGITIVAIVLLFFLGSLRSAVVVVLTIPISLVFAFLLMKLSGIPANLLSLGAIDFGLIVDGAVILVENMLRSFRVATPEERSQGVIHRAFESATEVAQEVFLSILIIICAYIPIFSFERIEGKLFRPMAFTLSFAIGGALLVSLTLVPVLMSYLYKGTFQQGINKEWENPLYVWVDRGYGRVLKLLVQYRMRSILIGFAAVFAALLLGVSRLGTEFLPSLDEGAFNIRGFFPSGIALQQANSFTRGIRESVASHFPVRLVITQLGRNDDGTDPYGPNRMETLVALKDYSLWSDKIAKEDLLKDIKSGLEHNFPGITFSFSQPILDNVTEAVTGSVADLAIIISGEDLNVMRDLGRKILKVIKDIPGSTEEGIEQEGDQAQLVVQVKRQEAARFGINVSDIQELIEAAIGGRAIGKLYDGVRRFDIVVRYTPEYRASIQAIDNLLVVSKTGAKVPLSRLADIQLKDGPTIIQRTDGKRQISVRMNIRGRDQGGFVKDAQAAVASQITLPSGYSLIWGGQFENLTRAGKQMLVVIPLTFVLILIILGGFFRRFGDVVVALSCIPCALVGGIWALELRGMNFNVSAGVGFISLFGIATMSGVLFVSRVNHMRLHHPTLELSVLVLQAARDQLRPWLMTTSLAVLGMVPAALGSGIGSEVQRTLATVVVGGLSLGIVLTVLLIPSLYLILANVHVGNDE